MKTRFLGKLLAAVLLVFHLSAAAEDIDLFVGVAPSANDLPNVLIVLDNTANWNAAFTNEIAAMKTVVSSLPVNADGSAKFRLGFMLFTETGGGNSGTDGGYVRAAVRPLTTDYKAKLTAMLDGFHKLTDKSNSGKAGGAMADAHAYFTNGTPYSGNNKDKTDYTGNTTGNAASQAIYAVAGNALSSKGATTYAGPIPADSCGKNFIIYISNGPAQESQSDSDANKVRLVAAGGAAAAVQIALSPSGSQTSNVDEWARFMKKGSLSVVTYTIDVDKITSGQGPGWTALLKSAAAQGGGKYYDVASSGVGGQILKAMEDIFSEIQSVNSVFAAVSLPVSVNTEGTFRNQVFIGMFRPELTGGPRWDGNLKQYKLGILNGALKTLDSTDADAINSSTGFITECAKSYWSPVAIDTYWTYRPLGGCIGIVDSDKSNYPDGNIVDKGAQAYQLRQLSATASTALVPRTVKTCSFAACVLTNFDSTTVTADDLGLTLPASPTAADIAAREEKRQKMINWARGRDVQDEHTGDGVTPAANDSTVMRPSVHGDVVHSRPVALNFGTEDAPRVVVFYGANDGVLRAVNGNRTIAIGSFAAGREMWSFIPPEFYTSIQRIYDNNVKLFFPNHSITTHTPLRKQYGMDGPVSAYKEGSTAWIYAAMRRGGRSIYAFNVDVGNPADITLKWKKGCNTNAAAVCTDGFANIGQTWSAPKTVLATGYSSGTAPLLMLSGGYDTCEDSDTPVAGVHACNAAAHTKKGNMVYVMDADTGSLLKTLPTERSVVADILIVPDATTGKAKYGYVADLGGNVYRINIGVLDPSAWTITKIASLGCATTANCGPNRKFLFNPDVVVDGDVNTLLIGSGDREKPLNSQAYPNANSVANKFFVFKDKPLDANWLTQEADGTASVCGSAVICLNSLLPIAYDGATPTSGALATKKGWALGLRTTTTGGITSGEQVVTSAITIFDTVYFSTQRPVIPAVGACVSNLGQADVFSINYKNAASTNGTATRSLPISGGGLPPSPVAGLVTLDNGKTVPFCIGCSPTSPLSGGTPTSPSTSSQPKARIYWYLEK